jgi:hypothetical protein
LSPSQIKELILKNTTPVAALRGKVSTGGKVDAHRAILALEAGKGADRKTASKK